MCEDAVEEAYRCLPRNLSYEGNIYHCIYYSPKVACKTLCTKTDANLWTSLKTTLVATVFNMTDYHEVLSDSEVGAVSSEAKPKERPQTNSFGLAASGSGSGPGSTNDVCVSVGLSTSPARACKNGDDDVITIRDEQANLSDVTLQKNLPKPKATSSSESSFGNIGGGISKMTSPTTTDNDAVGTSLRECCGPQSNGGNSSNDGTNTDGSCSRANTTLVDSDSIRSSFSDPGSAESLQRLLRATNQATLAISAARAAEEGAAAVTPDRSKSSLLSVPASVNDADDESEFGYLSHKKFQRSTSLKTNKTPPGTPHRKKVVRFADAMGLDLASVRHILDQASPPSIPLSAMQDLKMDDAAREITAEVRYLAPLFAQPSTAPDFYGRVQSASVLLENCVVNDGDMTITGVVRVANLSLHKRVVIRRSVNNWLTYEDSNASYVLNSNDGPTDRFSFCIGVPHYFSAGNRVEFAVMYTVLGQTFWDNNNGINYVVECYARATSPRLSEGRGWLHFL